MHVVGADGCRGGWVAVTLVDGRVSAVEVFPQFAALVAAAGGAAAIGVDMPIGLLETASRAADREARRLLGRAGSSVFGVPARPVLLAATYTEARRLARDRGETGVSAQAYALRRKIFEVEAVAGGDDRVYEVHPEVSFRELGGGAGRLAGKKTWDGLGERRELLRRAGIELPDVLGDAGRRSGADDVLDAAAAAWSALRVARGEARSLPDPPEAGPHGRDIAIWC